jgi:protein involved in polysaccharide export with SLBB domain
MKLLRILSGRGWLVACLALTGGLWFSGCRSADVPEFSSDAPGSTGTSTNPNAREVGRFAIGDQVTVTLIGPEPPIQPHEERIKEDGTITMEYIDPVKAAGKTSGELQKEIHDLYVPKYYKRLTVVVKSPDLSYSVGGEVKLEGPKAYLGETTLTKAIQAAGGFTDFANRKKIRLTRAGKTTIHNWYKIQENPALDPLVIPGDRVDVRRRLF